MKFEFSDLTVRFGSQVVLDRMSATIEGKALAIIGPSGGGKSTLLRVLGGLLPANEGMFALNGNWVENNEQQLNEYRKQIGFVFQSNGLFPHLSAINNITLPLVHTFGMKKLEAEEKAMVLLKKFGLEESSHKYPSQLSGGQQQRIAIIRAIAIEPKLLLLDEPTSALDPELAYEVLSMLKQLVESGVELVIVTHHLGFASNACDTVMYMDEFGIGEFGETDNVLKSPKTERLQRFISKILSI
ncbi:MAG: glutamine ABC transporter ATP-binding protein [Firmicutes bacterium HGW-Firmicutes-19]|jgi:polar amino acid transport system ATP-binding protein|nr:MAG: glutamine ABC transporter ATP-binding protein [Firmicutes bacterium HGW-Firmicutes-19]